MIEGLKTKFRKDDLDKMNYKELLRYAEKLEKERTELAIEVATIRSHEQERILFVNWQAYAIQHNVTKRIYIGSSDRILWRIREHLTELRKQKHPVALMQEDYDRYGEDYSFYRLTCDTWWCNPVEKKMQYMFRTGDPNYGYNYKENMFRESLNGFERISQEEIDNPAKHQEELMGAK